MKYIKHKPVLKDYRIWLALFVFLMIPYLVYHIQKDSTLYLIPALIVLFMLFNLIIRKSLSFKKYFTSPLNLLTLKVREEQHFDLDKALMFEKIIEVIEHSPFKLVVADPNRLSILATSSISWKSWGENLYIDLVEEENGCKLLFCSATLFQIYDWGKSEDNFQRLTAEIENSFTV